MKFGFFQSYETLVTDTSQSTDSTFLKNAVRCPIYDTCLNWTIDYHSISIGFSKVLLHRGGISTDENNRPLACQL